jgi:hypothetical protein
MFFAPVGFAGVGSGALLTGLLTEVASSDKTKIVAIAVTIKLAAESAKVRVGRIKLFMVSDVSSGSALIEQPLDERREGN